MRLSPSHYGNFLGVAVTVLIIVGLSVLVDIEDMRAFIENAGPYAPLAFILAKIAAVVIAPISGGPLYPIVGLFFGFWPGLLYVVIGDAIGYTIAFFISRTFGYPVVKRIIADREEGLLAKIVTHVGTTRGFLHMCLTCFAVPELIAYGTGLSRLRYLTFITIIVPLSSIGAAALVFAGSTLDTAAYPLVLSLGVPILAGVVITVGGWLFVRDVRRADARIS
jgi:uncharacterized membrane protein YdjX (TVP38/TMEM64 family)